MEAGSRQAAPSAGSARLGAAIAAGGGLLLLVSLFVPWYTLPGAGLADTPLGDIAEDIGGAVGVDVRDTISRTGWESFEFTDVACAIAAAVAMVRLAVAVFGGDDDPPVPGSLLVTVLGAIAVALVAYRFANPPFVGLDREIGVWLGLLGAGLITYGGAVAMRSRH